MKYSIAFKNRKEKRLLNRILRSYLGMMTDDAEDEKSYQDEIKIARKLLKRKLNV
jgi:hypothetical protein